jgi:hypothetical protein
MAPSLSTRPLFIRPVCEMQIIRKDNRDELKQGEQNSDGSFMIENIDNSSEKERERVLPKTNIENEEIHDDFDDWIDRQNEVEVSQQTLMKNQNETEQNEEFGCTNTTLDEESWVDNLHDEIDDVRVHQKHHPKCKYKHEQDTTLSEEHRNVIHRRMLIQTAVSSYLQKPISLENIATSIQRLRPPGTVVEQKKKNCPSLAVDMIVCENEQNDVEHNNNFDGDNIENIDPASANIYVIRMVNQIPLLDGAEASACGIVQGITRNHSMWNSFGLDVNPLSRSSLSSSNSTSQSQLYTSNLCIPTFSLRDSASVAPYFIRNRTHDMFEDDESSCTSDEESQTAMIGKRKKNKKVLLLPAGLRIGTILIIVQLEANPNELPLPTLSKVCTTYHFHN